MRPGSRLDRETARLLSQRLWDGCPGRDGTPAHGGEIAAGRPETTGAQCEPGPPPLSSQKIMLPKCPLLSWVQGGRTGSDRRSGRCRGPRWAGPGVGRAGRRCHGGVGGDWWPGGQRRAGLAPERRARLRRTGGRRGSGRGRSDDGGGRGVPCRNSYGERILARFFNPSSSAVPLAREYLETDVWGNLHSRTRTASPRRIVTVALEEALPSVKSPVNDRSISIVAGPAWRVGDDHGSPDAAILEQLRRRASQLERQLEEIAEQLGPTSGDARHVLQHKCYVLRRELYECRLSVQLNALKLRMQGSPPEDYLFAQDPLVAQTGLQLNKLRILRRIYDYVVQTT